MPIRRTVPFVVRTVSPSTQPRTLAFALVVPANAGTGVPVADAAEGAVSSPAVARTARMIFLMTGPTGRAGAQFRLRRDRDQGPYSIGTYDPSSRCRPLGGRDLDREALDPG